MKRAYSHPPSSAQICVHLCPKENITAPLNCVQAYTALISVFLPT
ncbi:hypothetical protein IAD21_00378 [Abditibacteriota bacterium]|nr:hypothetical protein IAD21_00378 [Abditibacteriota bacterium]